jgi:hypothetical protein
MGIDTVSGKAIIELAEGLKAALALRYIREDANMVGSLNGGQDRIQYNTALLGHGGGLHFTKDKFFSGATYYQAARGKATILEEERIVAEPGLAMIDGAYLFDQVKVGLGFERWVHKRDERAIQVEALDGRRAVQLNGVDQEKYVFPVQAYHFGLEVPLNQRLSLRLGFSQNENEFIFSDTEIPGDNEENPRVKFNNLRGAIRMLNQQVDVLVNAGFYKRATSLPSDSRRAGDYNASGQHLSVLVGVKF